MKVCVLGGGVMGSSIASLLLKAQFVESVNWFLRTPEAFDSHYLKVKKELRRICKGSGVSLEEALCKLKPCYNVIDLRDSELFIEAITENTEHKVELISQVSEVALEGSVFATNTSSLSITDLSMRYCDPSKFIGMHFFNPASMMDLVEVVKGLSTSDQTVNYIMSFAEQLGKEPVMVQESPGFIVNRMLIPMINEAITILSEGIASKEDIDKAMKLGANHPLGPIALADLIGNDVCLSIMETLHEETGDPKYRACPMLRQYVRAGRLGRKCRLGFYSY
ncbi:3-hydroxybutyryl-CoA dehydrogenase [Vibrio pectenicida]|uniref:3-hydroxybutyryl-CoA dehydrogenase n=1 Tax=Vibrio pectenicida TaxID=62763 RepID=A0A7Y3ZXL1_9VIBR|nr:3-hydroxyacyl-CoA dehydrogenase NAD-binding domain-containing protein [Vibrio pectenicida]NOH70314.1 3-hydroxybutyryl-CoA dehydrogenase [Vibrio pectenicida]